MRPTIAYLQENFKKYNAICFDGKMGMPGFALTRTKSKMGCCHLHWVGSRLTCNIDISVLYDLPEGDVLATLVHEMIHFYIAHMGFADNSVHGRVFKRIMNECRAKTGLNITTSYRASDDKRASLQSARPAIFIYMLMKNGRPCIVRVKPQEVQRMWVLCRNKWDVVDSKIFSYAFMLLARVRISSPAAIYVRYLSEKENEHFLSSSRELIIEKEHVFFKR